MHTGRIHSSRALSASKSLSVRWKRRTSAHLADCEAILTRRMDCCRGNHDMALLLGAIYELIAKFFRHTRALARYIPFSSPLFSILSPRLVVRIFLHPRQQLYLSSAPPRCLAGSGHPIRARTDRLELSDEQTATLCGYSD